VDIFAKRREQLRDQLDDRPLVVATNPETIYSNDVHNRFRPNSDFWYLTGFAEPGATLIMDGDKDYLFVRARDPKAEIWNGRRHGVERVEELGMLGRDAENVREFMQGKEHVVAGAAEGADDASGVIAELRLRKDSFEIEQLAEANRIGMIAMEQALACAMPGNYEFNVEAELLRVYRENGTWPGYPSIVGAGANGTVLHYTANSDRIKEGDLVLVDAGCEAGYYNSDITRTVCAGEMSTLQSDLYAVVAAAQKAAIAEVRPGNRVHAPHAAASKTLATGLLDLGLITDEKHVRNFYMHGTSHWLGLDVHDVGEYKVDGKSRLLEPGMCLTVEPGLYFNPDFAQCPEKTAGIGIRLENDIVVTEDGCLDLTAATAKNHQGTE
jgi:Xaa-Pro aminopeptidase